MEYLVILVVILVIITIMLNKKAQKEQLNRARPLGGIIDSRLNDTIQLVLFFKCEKRMVRHPLFLFIQLILSFDNLIIVYNFMFVNSVIVNLIFNYKAQKQLNRALTSRGIIDSRLNDTIQLVLFFKCEKRMLPHPLFLFIQLILSFDNFIIIEKNVVVNCLDENKQHYIINININFFKKNIKKIKQLLTSNFKVIKQRSALLKKRAKLNL